MGAFLAAEKLYQADFKAISSDFTEAARADGRYRGNTYPFCLPPENAAENLYSGIRDAALRYFARHDICWHNGQSGNPSNHLCSSQVCCVNFFYPFAHSPDALGDLLRPIYPALCQMLPIEDDQYVAFEWIGQQDYLGESKSRRRTRGANATSADAAVQFARSDGKVQNVLIEWKYTESYAPTSLRYARKSGTDRSKIYADLFDRADCPLDKTRFGYDALFYEPFYQFMRQQFLAHEMERSHELCADIVSVLHLTPGANLDFRRVTSPELRNLGQTATEVWSRLVRPPDRFQSVYTEDLFGQFLATRSSILRPWWEYITVRYRWLHRLSGDQ